MSELIAFEVYRTEPLVLGEEHLFVQFAKRKGRDEYALFAVSPDGSRNERAFYSEQAAQDLARAKGPALAAWVRETLRL